MSIKLTKGINHKHFKCITYSRSEESSCILKTLHGIMREMNGPTNSAKAEIYEHKYTTSSKLISLLHILLTVIAKEVSAL
jgi:hypothetical protein